MSVFRSLRCLSKGNGGLSVDELYRRKVVLDKRFPASGIERFLQINAPALKFVGVRGRYNGDRRHSLLEFETSNYVGSVNLLNALGTPLGDLFVSPNYIGGDSSFQELIELSLHCGIDKLVEFDQRLPPVQCKSPYESPLYKENVEFIEAFGQLMRASWCKFCYTKFESTTVVGDVDWNLYACSSHDPHRRLIFPTSSSLSTHHHKEFKQLCSLFDQAKACLEAPATPHNYRNRVAELLSRLSLQVRGVSREKPDLFHSGATDLPIVKRIKEIANRIILQKHSQSYAWRIDVALFFERYVQWIFEQTAKRIGGEMFCNPKYAGHGANFDWLLHYLEPDIVLKFAETQIIVDAKYKSYLYHKRSKSDTVRESFRNDLHQLLAYTAFSTEKKKHCILVAPFSRFEVSNIQYRSPFSDATVEIYCIGVPFSTSSLSETIDQLCDWCQSLA